MRDQGWLEMDRRPERSPPPDPSHSLGFPRTRNQAGRNGVVLLLVIASMLLSNCTTGHPAGLPLAVVPTTAGTQRSGVPDYADSTPAVPSVPAAFALSNAMAWVPLSPNAPNAGAGAGFAAVSSLGEGLLFGGDTGAGLGNASYLYDEGTNRWAPVATTVAPSPRSDFAFAASPGAQTAVLFGGRVNAASDVASNDTWQFSFVSGVWTNESGAVAPAPREDAAFAVGNGVALLFGGWDSSVGGSGEVTYSDTWILNLATYAWAPVTVTGGISPGALRGASLVWQPTLGVFVLFGGCYPCSNALWAFSPGTDTWTPLSAFGPAPSPRMEGVWVWDPALAVDLLFAGSNGTDDFNDTFYYAPGQSEWTRAGGFAAPSPRTSAAADFLDTPGNQTLLLSGGAVGGVSLSDTWRLSAVVNLTVQVTNASSGTGIANATVGISHSAYLLTNSSGGAAAKPIPAEETTVNATDPGYSNGSESSWLAPGENVRITLSLTPLNPANVFVFVGAPNGTAITNASVNITFGARLIPGDPRFTDPSGLVEFRDVPSAVGAVTASHPGFHTNSSRVDFTPGSTLSVSLTLSPTLLLEIQTLGVLPGGNEVPLIGASVDVGDLFVGVTDGSGWRNVSTNSTGLVKVEAGAYGFHNASEVLPGAFTGVSTVSLVLKAGPFPSVTVQVIGRSTGSIQALLKNATVVVKSASTGPTGPFLENLTTGTGGKVEFTPPPGNYTFQASAAGYQSNASTSPLDALPGAQLLVTIYLAPFGFSSLYVWVASTTLGHPPIGGAAVVLNITGVNLTDGLPYSQMIRGTDSDGWANVSGVPVTTVIVTASAVGFEPNSTAVVFTESGASITIELLLSPVPPGAYTGLRILPANPEAVWELALLPVAVLVGVLVYLTVLRTPTGRDDIPERVVTSPERRPGPRNPP